MVLRRNLIANYLGQGWAALMGLAFVPLYIKFLGIESYGLIGLFAVLQSWLSLLDMGLTPTLSREMARFTGGLHTVQSIRDLLRSIEALALGIAALIAGGVWLGSTWLATSWLKASSLPVPVVAEAFAVMGVVTALRFLEGIYRSSIVGLQRQVLLNAVSSVMATARGLGAVAILAWVAPTIQAFFLWQALVSIATVVILLAATYASLPWSAQRAHFSSNALRSVWRFAGGMLGITVLSALLTQVDKILLSKLLSLADYGYYTLAALVAGAPFLLISPITQAWLPRLTQLHAANDRSGMIDAYHQGAQLVAVVMGSASLVLFMFSETLMHLWTQDAALAKKTAPLLGTLALGNLLNGLMWIPYHTQLAHGWTSLTIRTNIVAVCIIVPAILWATPRYGGLGAALVWIFLNAGYVLLSANFMFRHILTTERWRWYLNDNLLPIVAALATATVIRVASQAATGVAAEIATVAIASALTLLAAILGANIVRRKAILACLGLIR